MERLFYLTNFESVCISLTMLLNAVLLNKVFLLSEPQNKQPLICYVMEERKVKNAAVTGIQTQDSWLVLPRHPHNPLCICAAHAWHSLVESYTLGSYSVRALELQQSARYIPLLRLLPTFLFSLIHLPLCFQF